jgi:hypothetical protein
MTYFLRDLDGSPTDILSAIANVSGCGTSRVGSMGDKMNLLSTSQELWFCDQALILQRR